MNEQELASMLTMKCAISPYPDRLADCLTLNLDAPPEVQARLLEDLSPDGRAEIAEKLRHELARAGVSISHVVRGVTSRGGSEVENLRWVLSVIGEQQDGAWGNLARVALDPTTNLFELRERWCA